MEKTDLKKQMKEYYMPSAKGISLVDVSRMKYLMIDGKGDPNTSVEYQQAIQTLFPMAYTIKFSMKKSQGMDFTVMPFESLWWADDMDDFETGNKDNWYWTAMIMQPDFVNDEVYEEALRAVEKKKNPVALSKMRFETYEEGLSAQILYYGPYSDEGPTIKNIHEKIREVGGTLSGKHHEIYLSDFRKVAPEKLKTIIRQPYKK